jgi:hypothetical protein
MLQHMEQEIPEVFPQDTITDISILVRQLKKGV